MLEAPIDAVMQEREIAHCRLRLFAVTDCQLPLRKLLLRQEGETGALDGRYVRKQMLRKEEGDLH